jgi:hypothetical protein
LYHVLHAKADAIDRVKETAQKNFSIIPPEVDLGAIEVEFSQKGDYLMRLRQCLAPIKEKAPFPGDYFGLSSCCGADFDEQFSARG